MDVSAVLIGVIVVFLSIVYIAMPWVRKAKQRHMINKLPGATAYPIIGSSYSFYGVTRSGVIKVLSDLYRQHGPIYRIWLGSEPEIFLSKPQHFEAIISGTKHLEKATAYKFMKPLLGTGLVTSSGAKWHSHRKMITPAFHMTILESFVEVFAENCDILIDKLEQNAVKGSSFDIYPYILRCALDIICETAMGVSIHAQDDPDSEYSQAVAELAEETANRRDNVWMHPDFIFYNTPTGRKYKQKLKLVQGFTKRVIQERKAALTNEVKFSHESSEEDRSFGIRRKKAFLDLLLEASQKEGKLTDEELREEVDTFMIAGHDTTAGSTSWTLFLLGHHPEVQEKAYEELEEIFQGSQRSPTMKDLHEMKYLDRVIKETLRLYPTVPFIQRVLSEDLRIDNYDIPAGTTVDIMIYFANRNPEYFPDPEKFDPDNFLPERVQKRHHFSFVPFSAGPRNCIGQKFALLEEKTILSSILRKFTIRSLQKREDVNPVPAITLRPENGIEVLLTLRK